MSADASLWTKRFIKLGLLAFVALALVGSVLFLLRDNPRSFVVQAESRGVSARIDHAAMSQWLLERAHICFRKERRDRNAMPQERLSEVCDPQLFDIVAAENLEVFWPVGAEIRLNRAGPASPMLIVANELGGQAATVAGRELSPADLIVVESDDWLANGPLTIAGHIVIGSQPGPGEVSNLIGGTYAVSERLPLAPAPTQILSGDLLSGDEVEILVRRDCRETDAVANECHATDASVRLYQPSQSFGFVEPRGADDAGFGITVYSETSDSSLSIRRFGASGIVVTPNWVHRALANPVLLGGSAILAILSGLASLSFLAPLGMWAWRRGKLEDGGRPKLSATGARSNAAPNRRKKR